MSYLQQYGINPRDGKLAPEDGGEWARYDDIVTLLEAPCTWTEDEDGAWDTDCGNRFEFNDGGPTNNHFTHCPYCGKVLKEKQ